MARKNSNDNDYTNNSDGAQIAGGVTKRILKWLGADITITGSGTNTYTFPSATDTLVGRDSTDTMTHKTLLSPKVDSLYDSSGAKLLESTATSGSNYIQVGDDIGGYYHFNAAGSNTNIGINLVPKGTGVVAANTVPVVTTTDTQKLTNKDLTDVTNTVYGMPNLLINGGFDVWQRNTTFTTPSDDTFTADRWNCLQEANAAWTFSRSTDAPDGSLYSMKAVNVTANNQAGFVYMMENIDAAKLKNKTVSLSLYAKTTAAKVISNLRVAVLSWNSTADAVTSDVVGTWAQNGTNPTWATNWTMENTPANLALANGTWTRYTAENILVDTSSMANVAVVIWVDDGTITAADEFYISQVQLNLGAKAAPFMPKPFADELRACQRYYEKSYDYGTPTGTNTGVASAIHDLSVSGAHMVTYQVVKRNTTLATIYDDSGNVGKLWNGSGGNVAPGALDNNGTNGFKVFYTGTSRSAFHWAVDCEL